MTQIKWEQCLAVAANKSDVAREILAMFVAELPEVKISIHEHWQNTQLKELAASVHRLQGGCCYTGVPQLKMACKHLMAALSVGDTHLEKNVHEVLHLISETINEYQLIKGNL